MLDLVFVFSQAANKNGDGDERSLSGIENLLDTLQLTAPSNVP